MTRMLKKLCLAVAVMAAAVSISATSALAQEIYVVEGGRTTITLTKGFIDTLANNNIVATTLYDSQLYNGKIDFPITSGAVSLKTVAGQMLHSGGINLTSGSKVVRIDSLTFNTLSDTPFVTGLVIVDGKFLGRIKLFDVELPSDLTLPIVPKDGDFFLSDVKLTLDGDAATALNSAFSVKVFNPGATFGYSLSLVFVPLAADGE